MPPAGAEACAPARPRLGVNEGTNDCDTRRPGLAHAGATPHRLHLLACIAAGGSLTPNNGSPVMYPTFDRRFRSESAALIDCPETAPCDSSGRCGSRPALDWPKCLNGWQAANRPKPHSFLKQGRPQALRANLKIHSGSMWNATWWDA